MNNFFLSLKTTVWTLLGLIGLFFIGAYMMPVYRQLFGRMNDLLLFDWAVEVGLKNPWQTWWFFLTLATLILLTVNTIVCSFAAIKGKWSRKDFLLRISPQIVHIGFLFVLLGHVLGAGWGYKLSGIMPQGAFAKLPENRALLLKEVRPEVDASGLLTNWSAEVSLFENNTPVKTGTLGPNQPLFYRGTRVYLMSLVSRAGPAAVLLVANDPGALWVLAGGILFILGSAILLMLKWKQA